MKHYMAVPALAGEATPQGAGPGANPLGMIAPLLIIVVLFYFMILRPQKREQQKQVQMRESVKKGDRVVSIGGIHGVVTGVDTTNNTVSVQVDKNVKIDFSRNAISTVISKEDAKENGESK